MTSVLFLGDLKVEDQHLNIGQDLLSLCRESSFVVANLEGPLVNNAVTRSDKQGIAYSSDSHLFKAIQDLSIDLLIIGNNHICDFGEEGVNETIKFCEDWNVSFVGAKTRQKSGSYIYKNDDLMICILSFAHREGPVTELNSLSYGPYILPDTDDLANEITMLANKGYKVFVSYHGGEEYFNVPWPRRLGWLKHISDSGACLSFGSHSHTPQPVFNCGNNRYIASGLGNAFFYTDIQKRNKKGRCGIAASYELESGVLSAYELASSFCKYKLEIIPNKLVPLCYFNGRSYFRAWEHECGKYLSNRLNLRPIKEKKGIKRIVPSFLLNYMRLLFLYLKRSGGGLRDVDILLGSVPFFGRYWARYTYRKGYKEYRF